MALIEAPEFFKGRDTEGLRSVYDYLVRLSDQLNIALNCMTVEQFVPEQAKALQLVTQDAGLTEAEQISYNQRISQQAETLKAYIIKTAHTVKAEMDEIFHEMVGTYNAQSDEGEYSARWVAQTQETALGTVVTFDDEQSMTVAQGMASYYSYQVETKQYIKTGQIGTTTVDGMTVPVYGLEIGTPYVSAVVDGKEILSESDLKMQLSSSKLSFFIAGDEVAYLSNSTLYISQAKVTSQLELGHLLAKVNTDGSVSIGYNDNWK